MTSDRPEESADSRTECKPRRAARILRIAGVAAVIASMGVSCARPERKELRVGFLPNLTHAVPMVMEARGELEGALAREVKLVPFNAGPSVIEALLAGDLDLAYVGPSPAINAYIRSGGRVRVLAAAAHGGAALVVRKELAIEAPSDLRRLRLATPQLGNTQDVALRQWLFDNDLRASDRGGNVQVYPMANSEIFSTFRAKEIDGAWVVEPWVSRLVAECGGQVLVDERELHPAGRYPTTVLVVTEKMLRERPADVAAIVRVNASTIRWVHANPARARETVNAALEKHTGKRLSDALIASAWKRLSFADDPVYDSLRESARAARRIGYLPRSDVSGILVKSEEWSNAAPKPRGAARR